MKVFTVVTILAAALYLLGNHERKLTISDSLAGTIVGSQAGGATCFDSSEYNECGPLDSCATMECGDFIFSECSLGREQTQIDGMQWGCQGQTFGFDTCLQWRPCTGSASCAEEVYMCEWSEELDECVRSSQGSNVIEPTGYEGCIVNFDVFP
jgi:hypothetical protein